MTAEGNFVLIRQERIPIRKAIWEMPAGQVDQLCDFIESFATLPIARSSEQLFDASENIRLLRSGRVDVSLC